MLQNRVMAWPEKEKKNFRKQLGFMSLIKPSAVQSTAPLPSHQALLWNLLRFLLKKTLKTKGKKKVFLLSSVAIICRRGTSWFAVNKNRS